MGALHSLLLYLVLGPARDGSVDYSRKISGTTVTLPRQRVFLPRSLSADTSVPAYQYKVHVAVFYYWFSHTIYTTLHLCEQQWIEISALC